MADYDDEIRQPLVKAIHAVVPLDLFKRAERTKNKFRHRNWVEWFDQAARLMEAEALRQAPKPPTE